MRSIEKAEHVTNIQIKHIFSSRIPALEKEM